MNCNQCGIEVFNHPSPYTKFCKECGKIVLKVEEEKKVINTSKNIVPPIPSTRNSSIPEPQINNTTSPSTDNTTKILLIVGILIGVLALSVALYFGLKNKPKEEVSEEAVTEEVTTVTDIPSNSYSSTTQSANNTINSTTSTATTSQYFDDEFFTQKIKGFYNVESSRNFDELYNSYLFSTTRYYDFNNPPYDKLKKRFEYLWGITSDVTNNLKSFTINRYDNHTQVNVLLDYSYFGLKTQEFKTVNDIQVVFNFDTNGNIIGIYDK